MAGGWFYNSRSGDVADETGLFGVVSSGLEHLGLGWHGPFKTLQDLVNFYDANKAHNPGWVPPQLGAYLKDNPGLTGVTADMRGDPGLGQKLKNQVGGTAGALTSSALGTNITGGFKWPGASNFLVRALKIIVGGVLLVAGVMKMTSLDNKALGVVTQAAAKLPGV